MQSNPCLDRKSLGNGIIKPKVGSLSPNVVNPQRYRLSRYPNRLACSRKRGSSRWAKHSACCAGAAPPKRKSYCHSRVRGCSGVFRVEFAAQVHLFAHLCAPPLFPHAVNCWAEPSGGKKMTVSIEYNLENTAMELHNVLIAIPLDSDSSPDVRVATVYAWTRTQAYPNSACLQSILATNRRPLAPNYRLTKVTTASIASTRPRG